MNINGVNYRVIDVYDQSITVPDSFVLNENKTGKGHGEAKLYMGPKDTMRTFYAGNRGFDGFVAKCFVLKRDLEILLRTTKHEYQFPSIKYRGIGSHKDMMALWKTRQKKLETLQEMVEFEIKDQVQIKGPRGYVKQIKKNSGYDLIREMALPFVSYISVMKLQEEQTDNIRFYWRPFADFSQMASMQYAAKNYGVGKNQNTRGRKQQLRYREELFNEFKYCPFSHIDDFRLLVASHIKPYAVSTDKEKIDSNNGLMLSPLYDRLFDRGFISFKDNGEIMISDWLSSHNRNLISFEFTKEDLRLNEQRKKYLAYHRENVFK